jgi:uncharacterized phage-associated protein
MAAYFLYRTDGGQMEHVKLMNLMYLADRKAIDLFGFSISNDEYWAMKMGPVLATVLNLMSGFEDLGSQKVWAEWVSAKENYQVSHQKKVTENDLDELADEEIAVLRDVFNEFGKWAMQNLINYTHQLREWIDPGNSRLPITIRDILEALGKSETVIEMTLRKLERIATIRSSPISFPDITEELDAICEA